MHTDSTPFDVVHTTTIGTTQLEPGHYTLKAKESQGQLEILRDDRIIASVPCQWIRLSKKAEQSEILSNNHQVTGVRFEGRKEAVKMG